mmetsp:Transcript_25956/g.54143  ORF Transcript_25956/g.54143 Transcript_25956/m.54143 type:complete len:215 (+) Transcript_25956:1489-2133(+)
MRATSTGNSEPTWHRTMPKSPGILFLLSCCLSFLPVPLWLWLGHWKADTIWQHRSCCCSSSCFLCLCLVLLLLFVAACVDLDDASRPRLVEGRLFGPTVPRRLGRDPSSERPIVERLGCPDDHWHHCLDCKHNRGVPEDQPVPKTMSRKRRRRTTRLLMGAMSCSSWEGARGDVLGVFSSLGPSLVVLTTIALDPPVETLVPRGFAANSHPESL